MFQPGQTGAPVGQQHANSKPNILQRETSRLTLSSLFKAYNLKKITTCDAKQENVTHNLDKNINRN